MHVRCMLRPRLKSLEDVFVCVFLSIMHFSELLLIKSSIQCIFTKYWLHITHSEFSNKLRTIHIIYNKKCYGFTRSPMHEKLCKSRPSYPQLPAPALAFLWHSGTWTDFPQTALRYLGAELLPFSGHPQVPGPWLASLGAGFPQIHQEGCLEWCPKGIQSN